ncbi:MAG: hypothetical protein HOH86_11045 [Verrucomicrobiales bacterium]|nr:hypothetical protein [Verrucomicrobiales bacterium]
MKQILVMMAAVVLVGCGDGRKEQAAIVERAIRHEFSLNKPEGELTEADLEKVREIGLYWTQITDAGLKTVGQLQQLTSLDLDGTQITDAGAAELRKVLPKCNITHTYKKD